MIGYEMIDDDGNDDHSRLLSIDYWARCEPFHNSDDGDHRNTGNAKVRPVLLNKNKFCSIKKTSAQFKKLLLTRTTTFTFSPPLPSTGSRSRRPRTSASVGLCWGRWWRISLWVRGGCWTLSWKMKFFCCSFLLPRLVLPDVPAPLQDSVWYHGQVVTSN